MSLLTTPHPRETVLYGLMKLRIREIRKSKGLTLDLLAEKAGISRSYLNELELGAKTINVNRLSQVAKALEVSAEDLIVVERPPIAVPGFAGAGDEVELVDAYAKGDGMYHVPCPPQISPHGVVALEVRGDSMEPYYQNGSIIFYSRDVMGVPSEAVGRICVAEDTDGRVWIKHVKPGGEPGLYHLISLNQNVAPMYDRSLKWAAPVRFHLPPDMVQRAA
ncbi:transcriptional regulator [Thioclava sp. NG1]|uniref:XRE family transcriptional regulator n=1 Tax=Thioclava sp. NG1 TaxID=2182426 RepID=UPI000D60610F|nr:helix-turn-helix domain-containing protein [Thioclava sp. NG1]PWE48456.1 transcriptional regulator [Thioclava sp. NG1]